MEESSKGTTLSSNISKLKNHRTVEKVAECQGLPTEAGALLTPSLEAATKIFAANDREELTAARSMDSLIHVSVPPDHWHSAGSLHTQGGGALQTPQGCCSAQPLPRARSASPPRPARGPPRPARQRCKKWWNWASRFPETILPQPNQQPKTT